MWIMVAGPYTSGAADAEGRAANLRVLAEAALAVFRRGHVPVIGVSNALPLIECAGPDGFEEVMMPLSLALADRCDAILRVGGASAGADAEVERCRSLGRPVFYRVEDVPG
ncbi:MAG: DUF4406 domain-containing protein [Alphaproteobacteria bacterium]|nr:MAG: DUF4406 domain-containing protein [Alphaproteobacteria bacterium]